MKRFSRIRPVVLALIFLPCVAVAQTPDRRGEIVSEKPEYRGERASAPIPPSMHVRNEGGSDGAGLCVVSSILANGLYQQVPSLNVPNAKGEAGKGSQLWRAAKAAPGGYYPEKLARLIQSDPVLRHEKYASYLGTGSPKDLEMLERLSKAGYPIGATMNTGALYGYQPINHMISLVHYRRNGVAMVVDNNRPNMYSIMPASEWERRWPDHGVAWAWIWTRLPTTGQAVFISATFLGCLGAAIIIVHETWKEEHP